MKFFTNIKAIKLMAAAGVVAFCCGTAPTFGADYTFTGVVNGGPIYENEKLSDYQNLSGDTIRATGGNASNGATGSGALHISGKFINRGNTEATGGTITTTAGAGINTTTSGVGIEVSGDIQNYGTLTATGAEVTTATAASPSTYKGNGGAGIKSVTGTLYNHNGTINAYGGNGLNHAAQGGNGIEVFGLENAANIFAYGGDAGKVMTGGDGEPYGGAGIKVSGKFVNLSSGTVTATGGTGLGASDCAHGGTGGIGLEIGGVSDNYGTLIAQGANTEHNTPDYPSAITQGGAGMKFAGLMTNYNIIKATGGTPDSTGNDFRIGGTGAIFIDGLINYDTVMTKGGDAIANDSIGVVAGYGILVRNGTYNYGNIVTQGGQKSGLGSGTKTPGTGALFCNGLTSYKDAFVTLLGYDGLTNNADVGAAITLAGPLASKPDLDYGAWFKLGSYLALGSTGAGAYIDAGGMEVVFEKDASGNIPVLAVISMVASSSSVGTIVKHIGFIQNTKSDLSLANLTDYTGPVMDVSFDERTHGNNFDFDFTAERIGWSSQITTGNASSMLSAWERDLAGQGVNETNYAWAQLLSSVDFQPTAEALRQLANELFGDTMPVATTQSMQSMGRAARFVDDLFSRNMQSLAKCRQTKACNYDENPNDRRNIGLVCGVDTDPLMIWAQPFYFSGRQNGKNDWFHKFNEDYYGVTTGVAYDADFAILSAELHYYQGDLKTKNYKADVNALGFELGIGRGFKIADNLNPWVEIRGGYTWMELDQKRTDVNSVKATSKPDAGVWTGGITVNNAFSVTEQLKITPKIGVDIMHMNMDGYTEKGSSLATKVKPDDYTSVQGTIGVQLDYNPTDDLYLKARAAYHYEFADKSADMKSQGVGLSSNLSIPGDDLSRSSATLGVGAGVKLTDNVSLQADYDVRVGDKYVGHQVSATLSFTF